MDDLAIGASGASLDGLEGAGAVVVAYGAAAGLNRGTTTPELLSRALFGVPGEAEIDDRFGSGLEAGDFDGDGRTELAVVDSSATWEEERLPVIQTFERYADGFLGPQPSPITQQEASVRSSCCKARRTD